MQKKVVTESTIKQQPKLSYLSAAAMATPTLRYAFKGAGLCSIAIAAIAVIPKPTFAQAALPQCQPPRAGEYLLLVLTETLDTQEQIRRTLPPGTTAPICQYLGDTVTRIGGFRQFDDADSWAQYVNDIVGLTAVVARPTQIPTVARPTQIPTVARPTPTPTVARPTPTPTVARPTQTPTVARPTQSVPSPTLPRNERPTQPVPATQRPTVARPTPAQQATTRSNNRPTPTQQAAASSGNVPTFNPQVLGNGYAVLVDYLNQPEIASQLKQELGKDIGLVSYLGRPYLLATSTESQTEANGLMRRLSESGFGSLVVNSNRVTLLTPAVRS